MLIELDTSITLVDVFNVKFPSRVVYSQYVYYQNLPKFCSYYYMFGHLCDNYKHLHPKFPNDDGKLGDDGKPLKKMTPNVEIPSSNPPDDAPLNSQPVLVSNLVNDNPKLNDPFIPPFNA